MTNEMPMEDINLDKEAEKICRWGAARASVIAATPLVGTVALMANEVYMIMRLADARGEKLEDGAIAGLLGSLGASFVGQTLFTLIPFAPVQIPLAIAVTYGVGKAASAWLKAGQPEDLAQFKEIFDEARDEGMAKFKEFAKMESRDTPLGDESKKFKFASEPIFNKIKVEADTAADKVENTLVDAWKWLQPLKEKGNHWFTAQNWDDISHGGLTIPYTEVQEKLAQSLENSEFSLKGVKYCETAQIEVHIEHEKHGKIKLVLSAEEFTINGKAACVRLKVKDFAVLDNDFAQLIVETMGTKLIMSIINAIFNETVLEKEDFSCTYYDSVLEVHFTQLIQNSKLVKIKFMDKNILDFVQFVALIPTESGLLVKSNLRSK
jgi:hypothetical protein